MLSPGLLIKILAMRKQWWLIRFSGVLILHRFLLSTYKIRAALAASYDKFQVRCADKLK